MADLSLLWLFLLQLVFIGLNAIFACAEIAVITMNGNKLVSLSNQGDKRAERLIKLTEQPASFLATIQVGITLVNLLSSAVATENFSTRLVEWLLSLGISIPGSLVNVFSIVIITVLLTYFTVLLGELIPKRLAMKNAEKIALGMSGLISWVAKIFNPAVWLFTVSTNGLLRLMGIDPDSEAEQNAEEEILMILETGKKRGTIRPSEGYFIENVFEFDDISAEEIMTHRTEVRLLWMEQTDQEWEATIYGSPHSIYPVCSNSPDNIVGILRVKDYFRLKDKTRNQIIKEAIYPAYFVPESVRANVLFRNMKQTRNHFAIVLDDYGGMSGIITMNDLLERLVGDLDDQLPMSTPIPAIERLDATTWRIRGTTSLSKVAKELGIQLPDSEYDTFGGFIFGLLGSVPADGSTPEIQEHGLTIKVTKIRDRRLEMAVVHLSDTPEQEVSD